MKTIRTVTGDIAPDALGCCQCHEHLFIARGKSWEINPALWMDDEAVTQQELVIYREAGGRSLVDAQPPGAGSMPESLRKSSLKTGVQIVASTGFHKLIFYPEDHWIKNASTKELTECFTADIEKGLALDADNGLPQIRCTAKAGVIKCALDTFGLNDRIYTRLFTAAAKAAKATGAPMMVHTENGAYARELVDFLKGMGVEAHRIIICHAERSLENIEDKIKIAKKGVYLECDTIARFKYHSDEDEALFLKRLCEEGYENRILLGLDTTRYRLKSYGGATGLDYIHKSFLPLLRNYGFSEKAIHKMLFENPAAALEFE